MKLKDTGIGEKFNYKDYIFNEFEKEITKTKRNINGWILDKLEQDDIFMWENEKFDVIVYATPYWENEKGIDAAIEHEDGTQHGREIIPFPLTHNPEKDVKKYLELMTKFFEEYAPTLQDFKLLQK